MFRSFLIILLLGFSCVVRGQISVRCDTNTAITNRNITNKSASRSITPQDIGHAVDSCLELIKETSALVASTGDLDAVLTIGNTSAQQIILDNGTDRTTFQANEMYTLHLATSGTQTQLGYIGGFAELKMKSPSGNFYSELRPGAYSASYVHTLPAEGSTGLTGTLVTHTTKDPITVQVGSNSAQVLTTGLSVTDGAGNFGIQTNTKTRFTDASFNRFEMNLTGGIPLFQYRYIGTYTTSVGFINPTADRTINFQDGDGTLAFLTDITGNVAGPDKAVQFNRGGAMGGSPRMLYDTVTKTLTIDSIMKVVDGFTILNHLGNPIFQDYDYDVTVGDVNNAVTAHGTWTNISPSTGIITLQAANGIDFNDKLDMLSHQIKGVTDPTLAQDAATKAYVDGFSDSKTARTAAVTLASYTVGATDEPLLVSSTVLINSGATYNFSVNCAYTDASNTIRTLVMTFGPLAGLPFTNTIVNTGGNVPYNGVPMKIRAKAGTTVTFSTAGIFTAVNYDLDCSIKH